MNTFLTQQEILLPTGTSFSNSLWRKDVTQSGIYISHHEQLEEACWNGFLDELLPEIMERKQLYMWHIHAGISFLLIELGNFPSSFEKEYSIDPNLFFPTAKYN